MRRLNSRASTMLMYRLHLKQEMVAEPADFGACMSSIVASNVMVKSCEVFRIASSRAEVSEEMQFARTCSDDSKL